MQCRRLSAFAFRTSTGYISHTPLPARPAGFDQGSRQVQDALMEQEVEEQVAGSIVLVLEVGGCRRLVGRRPDNPA